MDLSTLKAEWESRNAAAAAGGAGGLNGAFGLNNNNSSTANNNENEEIDVVGGLDSCSDSGSERLDSAADGSMDGESYPSAQSTTRGLSTSEPEPVSPRRLSLGHHQLNHQQGIHHWGLSLLERRRELVGLKAAAEAQTSSTKHGAALADDEAQSASIDLSVKGREERRRLNPFSIDSLLGNNRVIPVMLPLDASSKDSRGFKSPAASPTSSASSVPASPTLA